MSELSERLDFAVRAAIEAGAVTMRYFRSPSLAVDAKPDKSPVTNADKEAEELLREHIAREYPEDGIVGEEFGVQDGSSEYTWYLDPIDGTQSFFRGIPLFGTMVGLEAKGEAVAGVIVFPALKEMVFAGKGLGAWWCDDLSPRDRKKAYVSKVSRLSEACLSANSASGFERIGKEAAYRSLSGAVGVSRGYPDCYGHYLVATGRIEIMIDPVVNAWDNAPLLPIVEEAGGRFTDLNGNATIHGGSGISSNGPMHDEVVAMFKGNFA